MTISYTGRLGVDFTAEASASGDSPFAFAAGTIENGRDGTCWMATTYGSAILQYAAVAIDENNKGYPLTKAMLDDGWKVGFAQTAGTKGKRGWVAMAGSNISVLCLKACAADVALYSTATAGVLDDLSSSQTNIDGIVVVTAASASAPATGQALEVIATYPRSTTF